MNKKGEKMKIKIDGNIFIIFFFTYLTQVYGCAGAYSPGEKIRESALVYYEAFRWGKVQQMSDYFSREQKQKFVSWFNDIFSKAQIVDYEIKNITLDESRKNATITFEFLWHRNDETIVRKTVVADRWYDSGAGNWKFVEQQILEGEMP